MLRKFILCFVQQFNVFVGHGNPLVFTLTLHHSKYMAKKLFASTAAYTEAYHKSLSMLWRRKHGTQSRINMYIDASIVAATVSKKCKLKSIML